MLQDMVNEMLDNAMPGSPLDSQVGGDHYKKMGQYQPWEVLPHWLTPDELRGFAKGTVIAYLARERDKGGLDDIDKALHSLELYKAVRGKLEPCEPPSESPPPSESDRQLMSEIMRLRHEKIEALRSRDNWKRDFANYRKRVEGHESPSESPPPKSDAKLMAEAFEHIASAAEELARGNPEPPTQDNAQVCCGNYPNCDTPCVPRANFWKSQAEDHVEETRMLEERICQLKEREKFLEGRVQELLVARTNLLGGLQSANSKLADTIRERDAALDMNRVLVEKLEQSQKDLEATAQRESDLRDELQRLIGKLHEATVQGM